MAYRLAFKDSDIFRIAYEGFLVQAKGNNRQEHRMIDKILAYFESISMAEEALVIPGFAPNDPVSPRIRYLDTTRDGVVIFEDSEFDYFKGVVEKLAGPAILSRLITRLLDFVDTAERGDAKTLASAR